MAKTRLADPREVFVDELVELGKEEQRLVVLDADVSRTTRTRRFRDAYPDRFYDIGVAEQNMFGIAAGLAATGCTVLASSLAIFASMRATEIIRTSICYPGLNVKVLGGYAGLSNGKDGATHHSLEDVAIMRSLPNMVVLSPSDAVLTRKVARAAIAYRGPVYVRLEYEHSPIIYDDGIEFAVGRGLRTRCGSDVTLASYGLAVVRCLEAAALLSAEGVSAEVLDMASLKPLDTELLLSSARKTGAVVTVEDHSIIGGLGSAVCECLMEEGFLPHYRRLGVPDVFTESGTNAELRDKYGTGCAAIVQAARQVVAARTQGPDAAGGDGGAV